eukprot:TRINITY_DN478_c0_g1_i1.p1 TRINITY_DN478_c0_g1~~TRINITY_DN478_c0_g1_i1.p1  ORF type:complete len:658 (+),score=122.67 TRINITY_DN478_c0_g1_i1:228-2201(+)
MQGERCEDLSMDSKNNSQDSSNVRIWSIQDTRLTVEVEFSSLGCNVFKPYHLLKYINNRSPISVADIGRNWKPTKHVLREFKTLYQKKGGKVALIKQLCSLLVKYSLLIEESSSTTKDKRKMGQDHDDSGVRLSTYKYTITTAGKKYLEAEIAREKANKLNGPNKELTLLLFGDSANNKKSKDSKISSDTNSVNRREWSTSLSPREPSLKRRRISDESESDSDLSRPSSSSGLAYSQPSSSRYSSINYNDQSIEQRDDLSLPELPVLSPSWEMQVDVSSGVPTTSFAQRRLMPNQRSFFPRSSSSPLPSLQHMTSQFTQLSGSAPSNVNMHSNDHMSPSITPPSSPHGSYQLRKSITSSPQSPIQSKPSSPSGFQDHSSVASLTINNNSYRFDNQNQRRMEMNRNQLDSKHFNHHTQENNNIPSHPSFDDLRFKSQFNAGYSQSHQHGNINANQLRGECPSSSSSNTVQHHHQDFSESSWSFKKESKLPSYRSENSFGSIRIPEENNIQHPTPMYNTLPFPNPNRSLPSFTQPTPVTPQSIHQHQQIPNIFVSSDSGSLYSQHDNYPINDFEQFPGTYAPNVPSQAAFHNYLPSYLSHHPSHHPEDPYDEDEEYLIPHENEIGAVYFSYNPQYPSNDQFQQHVGIIPSFYSLNLLNT